MKRLLEPDLFPATEAEWSTLAPDLVRSLALANPRLLGRMLLVCKGWADSLNAEEHVNAAYWGEWFRAKVGYSDYYHPTQGLASWRDMTRQQRWLPPTYFVVLKRRLVEYSVDNWHFRWSYDKFALTHFPTLTDKARRSGCVVLNFVEPVLLGGCASRSFTMDAQSGDIYVPSFDGRGPRLVATSIDAKSAEEYLDRFVDII
jgi:hypothetical protein